MANRERWLNGWERSGLFVNMAGALRCAGCGQHRGQTCVVIDDDWVEPGPEPDWQFEEADCPVCRPFVQPEPVDKLTARMLALKNKNAK